MYTGALPATSNREDWRAAYELIDPATGATVDIQLCAITMTVRDFKSKCPKFNASTDGGEITIAVDNTFQWLIPADTMAGLCQGQYEVGLRISQSGRVAQIMISTLQVLEGIDQQ
jgi:hypothetical protein